MPSFNINIARSNWALRVSVKKNIPWCNNNGKTISCKSVLLIINLQLGLLRSGFTDIFPNFNTDWIYSNVEISSNCIEITSLIVINPFLVLVIWIYPSPSIKPTKKAINDEGGEKKLFFV